MNRFAGWCLLLALLLNSPLASATVQNGIAVETSFGYPMLSAKANDLEAKYNGFSVIADILFPIVAMQGFTIDLDLGYRFSSYQNNASNLEQSEWAILQGFSPGFRFNFKYIFAGVNASFLQGKHLIAGTTDEINEYQFVPIEGTIGIHIPINDNSSIALSYSQYLLADNPTVRDNELEPREHLIMLRIQFDTGIGFFNTVKEKDPLSFEFKSL